MAGFPHTHLLLGPSRAIVISGPHIQIVDVQTGDILQSTVHFSGATKDVLLKSGPIRCCAVDEACTHLVTAGEDKRLKVWQVDGLQPLSERELPKKPTEIRFTRDGLTILVSDKFGDIFSYPLHPVAESIPASSAPGASKRGTLTSHENAADGTLVLGHASLLTCFLLSPDERHVLSADRDEHIRVSWFPQGYTIERFCLGHEKFVSALHIPRFAHATLVSGGGDPVLKLWDWMEGTVYGEIQILDAVAPYIKVRAPRGKWGREDGEGEDGEQAENSTARKRKRGRKGRGKGKDVAGQTPEAETEADADPDPSAADETVGQDSEVRHDSAGAPGEDSSEPTEVERLVHVLHKIESVDLGAQGRFLLFIAVGASALFYCSFPESGDTSTLTVHPFDLGRPVLDFTVGAEHLVWVLLDGTWAAESEVATTEIPQLTRLLTFSSGVLSEVPVTAASVPALLLSLQTKCVIAATPAELKALDLYAALASLPKNVDPEHDPMQRDVLAELAAEPTGIQEKEKELTLREQARLKKKRALAAKLQAQALGNVRDEKDGEGTRESKRAKSETDKDCDVPDTAMNQS
ncbi:WD40-repeat-containing domain protein [Amylocystis lapponica]|nr:WD40-repeat-containing domain protein [Amylocystis lapponica]